MGAPPLKWAQTATSHLPSGRAFIRVLSAWKMDHIYKGAPAPEASLIDVGDGEVLIAVVAGGRAENLGAQHSSHASSLFASALFVE